MSRRHRGVVLVAVLGCAVAVAVAACGAGASSYSASGSAGSGNSSAFLNFAVCMRSNGVPNFPDPSGGGGIQIPANSGINPQAPAFQAARAKCTHLLPGGGPPKGPPSSRAKLAMLKTAECMRRHGVTDFPDPTLTLPPDPMNYGEVTDDGGVVLAVPKTINVQSPAYQQAAAACNFH